MTDDALVLRKLTSLRDHASRMRRRRPEIFSELATDVDRQDALGMSLLVAVQDALDIALHIGAEEGWGIPASYAEGFEILAKHGVITSDLALAMAKMAAVRNRLAHGYASVDLERLWLELPAGLAAIDSYAAAVATWLGHR